MATKITLNASDGHSLGAYEAKPSGAAKGGLVVIQEIFGVNSHIRNLVDEFASKGFHAVAPALFDRAEKDVDLGYDEKAFAKGRELRGKINDDTIAKDVQAAVDRLKGEGKVGIIGYCFGGYVSWLAAAECDGLAAAVSCYGGGVTGKADLKPKCPVQFHFGDKDHAIPLDGVEALRKAHPEAELYVYDDAAHGFCCDDRDVYNPGACERAHTRATAFLQKNFG